MSWLFERVPILLPRILWIIIIVPSAYVGLHYFVKDILWLISK